MPIGSKIKSLRIERGLTQKQLGDLCGMADSAIRRYESDRGNPTEKTIRRIAAALGVSVACLQSWDEAVADLEEAGMSINDVAEEMNIPVERIMEIMSNKGVNSSETAEKIILVASLLADEANKAEARNGMMLAPRTTIHKPNKNHHREIERMMEKEEGYLEKNAVQQMRRTREEQLLTAYGKLNDFGQAVALVDVERLSTQEKYTDSLEPRTDEERALVEEGRLAELWEKRYSVPQEPPTAPSDGRDTTTTENAATGPQEAK